MKGQRAGDLQILDQKIAAPCPHPHPLSLFLTCQRLHLGVTTCVRDLTAPSTMTGTVNTISYDNVMDEGHWQRSRQQEVKPQACLAPAASGWQPEFISSPLGRSPGADDGVAPWPRFPWAPSMAAWALALGPHRQHCSPACSGPAAPPQLPDARRCAVSQMGLQRGSPCPPEPTGAPHVLPDQVQP